MNRLFLLGGLVLAVAFTGVRAEDEKAKSIKEVMKEAHGGKGLRTIIQGSAKKADWDTATNAAKTWVALANDLAKGTPPKGEKESWKEMTGKYTTTIKGVEEAVGKKDAKAVEAKIKEVNTSCMGCHKGHKGK
jgi:cytochrome c556